MKMYSLALLLVILCNSVYFSIQSDLVLSRQNHKPQNLSVPQIKKLAKLTNETHFNEVLDRILIPRVVGTPNHNKVHNFIVDELKKHNWDVQVDAFKDVTPIFGELTFKNIIGTLNPNADRYLVLACHYDSKYFRNEDFLGATDSAVPCAMMLNLIHVMQSELNSIKDQTGLSLMLIFFDGEEAFENWGPTDSIYGAKHLANKFNQNEYVMKNGKKVTDLDRIDVLMLLDLLGSPDPVFYSFFRETDKWFVRLVNAEHRLQNMGQIKRYSNNRQYFVRKSSYSFIEDDHIPFLKKGVPILHLIPNPFPNVWHTIDDNRDAVDFPTVENLNRILRVFVSEYLYLSVTGDPSDEDGEHTEL